MVRGRRRGEDLRRRIAVADILYFRPQNPRLKYVCPVEKNRFNSGKVFFSIPGMEEASQALYEP